MLRMLAHAGVLVCLAAGLESHAATLHVDRNSVSCVPPYSSWASAATNIQDAVDAAQAGDTVLVTNGVYATGSRVTPGYSCLNRVVINKAITVTSVNGPEHTIIFGAPDASTGGCGDDAVRGVYLSTGTLSGITVTNGYTRTDGDWIYDSSGGGVYCTEGGMLQNCIIDGNEVQGNEPDGGHASGGGVYCTGGSTVQDCTIRNNRARGGTGCYGCWGGFSSGGGVYCTGGSTVRNCTICSNVAYGGDGGNGTGNAYVEEGGTGGLGGDACGGGVYCWDGTVQGCTISNNWAHGGAGGNGGNGGDYMPGFGGPGNGGDGGNGGNAYGGGAYYWGETALDCTLSGNSVMGGEGGGGGYGGMGMGVYDDGAPGRGGNGGDGNGGGNCYGAWCGCMFMNNSAIGGLGGQSPSMEGEGSFRAAGDRHPLDGRPVHRHAPRERRPRFLQAEG